MVNRTNTPTVMFWNCLGIAIAFFAERGHLFYWFDAFMKLFIAIVMLHFIEHIAQLIELYVLKMPRPECLGLLGILYPPMMHSEWLHYFFACFMVIGFDRLRAQITQKYWWDIGFRLQQYHHFEHLLLLAQVIIGINLFSSTVPCSIGQIWFPRIELHFVYNLMVMGVMLIAFYPKRQKTIGDSAQLFIIALILLV